MSKFQIPIYDSVRYISHQKATWSGPAGSTFEMDSGHKKNVKIIPIHACRRSFSCAPQGQFEDAFGANASLRSELLETIIIKTSD